MTLIERLRQFTTGARHFADIEIACLEAANEIQRLQEALAALSVEVREKQEEIERLKGSVWGNPAID